MQLLSAILLALPLSVFATPTAKPQTSKPAPSPLEARAPIGCSQCQPLPEVNKCDITTSCVFVNVQLSNTYYCACRAGYRANPFEVGNDPAAQWRLPWPGQEGRVFVRPGVKCDTLCDDWQQGAQGCQAIPRYDNCY